MTFGEYVKGKREELSFSQRKLAELTGIAHSTISRIEGDKTIPDMQTIVKLCEWLPVDGVTLCKKFFELTKQPQVGKIE